MSDSDDFNDDDQEPEYAIISEKMLTGLFTAAASGMPINYYHTHPKDPSEAHKTNGHIYLVQLPRFVTKDNFRETVEIELDVQAGLLQVIANDNRGIVQDPEGDFCGDVTRNLDPHRHITLDVAGALDQDPDVTFNWEEGPNEGTVLIRVVADHNPEPISVSISIEGPEEDPESGPDSDNNGGGPPDMGGFEAG